MRRGVGQVAFGRLTVYPRRAVYYRSAVRMGSGEGSGEPQKARCQLSRGRRGTSRSTLDHVSRRGHSEDEARFLTIGASTRGSILVVAHTERNDTIRIIGARRTTRQEREFYEQS